MKGNTLRRYYRAYISNIARMKLRKVIRIGKRNRPSFPVKYGGSDILPKSQGSDLLEGLITAAKPFALVRFGGSELGAIHQYMRIQLGLSHSFSKNIIHIMGNNAGFFPSDDTQLHRYGALIQQLCPSIDVVTVYNQFMEDHVINVMCDTPILLEPKASNPIFSNWTRSLKGMKVLVIHPYADLIAGQYEKREFLYPGTDILPEFDLKVFPAVQTSAGQKDPRFKTWFEALDYMMNGISQIDFDIALVGAGAYGMPLAIRIKEEMNKKAVQLGGLVQILFGIRGKRWDQAKALKKFYNEHWVRPGADFRPEGADKVEDGCYW